MSKRFWLILAGLLVIFLGVVFINKNNSNEPATQNAVNGTNHTQGSGTSGVALVEFGDFQCPACGSYYPIVKQIKQAYGDEITFQFRHYPLVSIHQNAMAAHRAAEAAGNQGKFWEMHDLLYERQQVWSPSTNVAQIFEDYAAELGLNVDTFNQDVASSSVNDIINADVKAAQAAGATSTPTFVLDGKRLEEPPKDLEGFKQLIDQAIANKQ